MPTRPPLIFHPAKIPSVQILFLSEGFSHKLQFIKHVDGIFEAFLTIDPFQQARDEFAAWAHFVPSVDGPVNEAEQNTGFGFFVSQDGSLTTLRPQRLVEVISDLKVSIPHIDDPLGSIDGNEVWLNRLVPQQSIVCVLANNPNATSRTVFEWPAGLLDPQAPTPQTQELLPCIFLSSWVLTQRSEVQYANSYFAVALTLAKQIGLLFGLADEKELPGIEHKLYLTKDPLEPTITLEPLEPNVTALGTMVDSTGQLQIDLLKWKERIPAQRHTGLLEVPHPIPPTGATAAQIEQLFEETALLGDSSVLVIRHPGLGEAGLEAPNVQRYLSGSRKPLWLKSQVNLFEGAAGYRQGIFRPSCECLMRFEGYDVDDGDAIKRSGVPFCRICHEHLQRALSGFGEFTLDRVKIKSGLVRFQQRIDSRVAGALLRYIAVETPEANSDGRRRMWRDSGDQMVCVEATARRFEGLFNDRFHWSETRSVPAGRWEPMEVQLPFRLGVRTSPRDLRRAWAIWNTKLQPNIINHPDKPKDRYALSRWNSRKFAGLGAAGAVEYLGFGCLVNRRIRRRMIVNDLDLGGDVEIYYDDVVPLTVNDFRNIQPGAILQIWYGGEDPETCLSRARENFRNIIAYVEISHRRRKLKLEPLDPPYSGGHSLFFVRMENEQVMIADQEDIEHSLQGSWPPYPFWIATQWFDATGVRNP